MFAESLCIYALDAGAVELMREQAAAGYPQLVEAEPTWLTALNCEIAVWRLEGKSIGHVMVGNDGDDGLKARLWVLAEQLRLDDGASMRLALVPHEALEWLTPRDAEIIVPFPREERTEILARLLKAWGE